MVSVSACLIRRAVWLQFSRKPGHNQPPRALRHVGEGKPVSSTDPSELSLSKLQSCHTAVRHNLTLVPTATSQFYPRRNIFKTRAYHLPRQSGFDRNHGKHGSRAMPPCFCLHHLSRSICSIAARLPRFSLNQACLWQWLQCNKNCRNMPVTYRPPSRGRV